MVPPTRPEDGSRPHRAKGDRRLLLGLAAVVFLAALDQTMVVTVLPPIMRDLHIPLTRLDDASWIVTGYLLGLSLIHISEPTRRTPISYAVFCLKKKKNKK